MQQEGSGRDADVHSFMRFSVPANEEERFDSATEDQALVSASRGNNFGHDEAGTRRDSRAPIAVSVLTRRLIRFRCDSLTLTQGKDQSAL